MKTPSTISSDSPWYALFSRGARDWLRHNEKIRESVQQNLPGLICGNDLITGTENRMVHVPVRVLEHARFRLVEKSRSNAHHVGQGQAQPGEVLQTGQPGQDNGEVRAASGEGEVRLLLEIQVDDIIDWIWDELKLPELQPKRKPALHDKEFSREGWDKHGARARLDRRRTAKEAVKRRTIQNDPVPFSNEDLRFRPLIHKQTPTTSAVVIFGLDVSASMTEAERKLAKTFFFFALEGIRRKYGKVETRFIAHTTQAWEFSESEFFQVTGTGGTGASTAFHRAVDMIKSEYDPSQHNIYFFYASDGENFTEDRNAAISGLTQLTSMLNFVGYVETAPGNPRVMESEMGMICKQLEQSGASLGSCVLNQPEDVWKAIRQFFQQDSSQSEHI